MKRIYILVVLFLTVAALCLISPALVQSQTNAPEQSNNKPGWYCPYCGGYMGPGYGGGYGQGGMMSYGRGYGMGPGMMGGYGGGYGMDPGMMGGYGYGRGYGMGPGYGPQYRQPSKPLEEKDAKAEVEDYLKSARNPNLKMGSIKDTGNAFEVEILTKNNSLVDKILVDKNTGWMKSEY